MKSNFNAILLLTILFISFLSSVQAQDCSVLASGSDAGFDQFGACAPVTGRVKYFTFYTITELPATSLKVEVNWGDGSATGKVQKPVQAMGYDENLKMYVYQMSEAKYIYPANRPNPKCSYPVTVRPVVDGKVCGSPTQTGTVVVWDTDNAGGASLVINPKTYFACPGAEITVDFSDNSTWNCIPPNEKVNINWPKRTTQFVYGTTNTITGEVMVDGNSVTINPFAGPMNEHPEKAQTPSPKFVKSAKITIPATAKVGEVFEIALNNWNYCNPLPKAPAQERAVIKIIAKPLPKITITNKQGAEVGAFCPSEEVRLNGNYYVEEGAVLANDVRYDWEVINLLTNQLVKYDNRKDVILPSGFALSGPKKVILKVTNKQANAQVCVSTIEKIIDIIDAPKVETKINGVLTKEVTYCVEDPANTSYPVTINQKITSNENFSYTYHLFKKNSTAVNPDSTLNIKTGVGNKSVETMESYTQTYTKAGIYRVRLVAKNNTTGCSTVEEAKVAIYEKPIANFTFNDFCVGLPGSFIDKSIVSTTVPGDEIAAWEWDLNYSAENKQNNTFDVDHSGKGNFNWKYTAVGSYNVALRIKTKAGCSAFKEQTIYVKDAPGAKIRTTYAGELLCPGDTVRFFNESFSLNPTTRFPEGVAYWLCVSDGVATKEIPMEEGQTAIDYSNFFNPKDGVEVYKVWIRAKAKAPNNCTVDSNPVVVNVKSGAAAGYITQPSYSPFEPNCSPKAIRFITNKATQDLKADRYRWTIILDGKVKQEIVLQKGVTATFDTLDYSFENNTGKYLDYVVKLAVEKSGICVIPVTNIYRIYPNPKPQFTLTPVLDACDSVVFEVKVLEPSGISDYTWTFSPNAPANDAKTGVKDDNFFIAYNRPAYGEEPKEYTVKLKAKNFYGCTGEWTEKLIVNPVIFHEPVLQLEGENVIGCKPLKATFVNATVGDASKTIYELYIDNITTGSRTKVNEADIEGDLKSRFSYTFKSSGKFKVYLKGRATVGKGECTRTMSTPIDFTVESDPNPGFTVFPAVDCGSLTAVISKKALDSSYNTWSVTDVATGEVLYGPTTFAAAEDNFNEYTFINSTNKEKKYRIKLTAKNSFGCKATDSVDVTVFAKPKANFDVVRNACEPYLVEVQHDVANNLKDVEYTWIWGDGTTSVGPNPPAHAYRNNSYTNTLYYDLKLIAKSKNGCVTDSTIRIKVHPKIKANFDADVLSGCAPLNVGLINKSQGAQQDLSGWYIREVGVSTFSFVNNTLAHYVFENNTKAVKKFEVMFVAKNAGGCADSAVKEISVHPKVVADFSVSPAKTAYHGNVLKFTNNHILPGVEYAWNWGDGSKTEVTRATEVHHAYENTRSTTKKYFEVVLSAKDPVTGCFITKKEVITIYPKIELSISPKKEKYCLPEVPEYNLLDQNVSSRYWYVGVKGKVNYTKKVTNIYDPALFANPTNGPLTYEVMFVGTTVQGFKDSVKTEVIIYPELKPNFTVDGIEKKLPNAVYTITNNTPGADGWVTTWDFGNGESSSKIHPGTYQYKTYGPFTITLTISNGLCSKSYSMRVNVRDASPEVSYIMESKEGCWPVVVKFTNTSKYADNTKYFWDFGDGEGTSTAISPTYTYNKPGVYRVTLNAYNRTGTENSNYTATEEVRVYARPRADFEVHRNYVYAPEEPLYVANYSERGRWYRWDFGDGTIYEGTDAFEPVHYYQEPGVYDIKLLIRSEHGCMDSVTMKEAVRVLGGGQVTVPNAFTPNISGGNGGRIDGSGQNDVFHPVFKGVVVKYHLSIFNRWGELLFQSRDMSIGWDGYYKGRLCKSDVYIYKLSAELSDGKIVNKVGDVMLVR